jgi:hypothetical protein
MKHRILELVWINAIFFTMSVSVSAQSQPGLPSQWKLAYVDYSAPQPASSDAMSTVHLKTRETRGRTIFVFHTDEFWLNLSEVRSQRSEIRGQRAEVRNRLLFTWLDRGPFNEFGKCFVSSSMAIEIRFPNFFKRDFHRAKAALPYAKLFCIRHVLRNHTSNCFFRRKENQRMRQAPRNELVHFLRLFTQGFENLVVPLVYS